jgi:type IV secretory pathway VirB9-like protein
MRALLLSAVAVSALAASARALDTPQPISAGEPHMRSQVYDPAGRTELIGSPGRATIITFDHREEIKRVVTGTEGIWNVPDREELQNAPLNNILPLWADKPGRTTIQVVTARPGLPDRVYQLAAEVRPPLKACGASRQDECPDDPNAIYGLTFVYPEDEKARREAAAAEARREAAVWAATARGAREAAVARARLAVDFACRNWMFEAKGDPAMAPDETCDNGQQTAFRYLGGREVPSVFTLDASGKEQAVQAAARPANEVGLRGIWWIVPGVHRVLHLRLPGGGVLYVFNRNYDPVGTGTGTGTTSPDVIREVVQAGAPRR